MGSDHLSNLVASTPDDFIFTPKSNSRLIWQNGQSPTDRDFTESAENVLIKGAFNVNSVSIRAWATLLSSMIDVKMGPGSNPAGSVAFNRFIDPVESSFDSSSDDYYSAEAY